jgi:hypothetical protein
MIKIGSTWVNKNSIGKATLFAGQEHFVTAIGHLDNENKPVVYQIGTAMDPSPSWQTEAVIRELYTEVVIDETENEENIHWLLKPRLSIFALLGIMVVCLIVIGGFHSLGR